MILLLGIPFLLIVTLLKYLFAKPRDKDGSEARREPKTLLDILKGTYTRGEIDREAYLQKREDLQEKLEDDPVAPDFSSPPLRKETAMNNTHHLSRIAAYGLTVLLAGTAQSLLAADQPAPPRQNGSTTPGCYGPGSGMMGGGYSMGPGMMGGGYGMGPGMMGAYWGSGLDLSTEQQASINKIQDETRKAHWALMGEMMNQQAHLRDLYQAPKRDDAAIDAAYKAFGKLHQNMYESTMEAQKRMEAVLTKEQQEKLRAYWQRSSTPVK